MGMPTSQMFSMFHTNMLQMLRIGMPSRINQVRISPFFKCKPLRTKLDNYMKPQPSKTIVDATQSSTRCGLHAEECPATCNSPNCGATERAKAGKSRHVQLWRLTGRCPHTEEDPAHALSILLHDDPARSKHNRT